MSQRFVFENRELEIRSQQFKYYQGTLVKRWTTEMGHLNIQLAKPVRIKQFGDTKVRMVMQYPFMNFLVPKSKEFIFNKLQEVPLDSKILVQLGPAPRSEKLNVMEFQIVCE